MLIREKPYYFSNSDLCGNQVATFCILIALYSGWHGFVSIALVINGFLYKIKDREH